MLCLNILNRNVFAACLFHYFFKYKNFFMHFILVWQYNINKTINHLKNEFFFQNTVDFLRVRPFFTPPPPTLFVFLFKSLFLNMGSKNLGTSLGWLSNFFGGTYIVKKWIVCSIHIYLWVGVAYSIDWNFVWNIQPYKYNNKVVWNNPKADTLIWNNQ